MNEESDFLSLEYEKEIFAENISNNSVLNIFYAGINVDTIIAALLSAACIPNALVLITGLESEEQLKIKNILKGLCSFKKDRFSRIFSSMVAVDSSISCDIRKKLYMAGGLIILTSRIFLNDILTDCLPTMFVCGLFVFHAESVTEFSSETFALKLFREKNCVGFIKAFSDQPEKLFYSDSGDYASSSFAVLTKRCKYLNVSNVLLWPKFHETISRSLDQYPFNLVELRPVLDHQYKLLQTKVMEVKECLQEELAFLNPDFDMEDEESMEIQINSFFVSRLHEISSKSRQIIAELKELKKLIKAIVDKDSIDLLHYLNEIFLKSLDSQSSYLLNCPQFETILKICNERISGLPFWNCLSQIMKESSNNIIVVFDKPKELLDLIQLGINGFLTAKKLNQRPTEIQQTKKIFIKRDRKKETLDSLLTSKKSNITKNVQNQNNFGLEDSNDDYQACALFHEDFRLNLDLRLFFVEPIYIQEKLLKCAIYQSKYDIVLCNPSVECLRTIEIMNAKRPTLIETVYFVVPSDSIEEKNYLNRLKTERRIFERFIQEKSVMVLHEQTPKEELFSNDFDQGLLPLVSTPIMVDTRDMRCNLPFLLYNFGFKQMVPVTLPIADYVLSKDCGIERKSVADMISSFASGRLFDQVERLCKIYSKPMLLIEFEFGRPFSFQAADDYSIEISSRDVFSKIVLLTLHFKKLKLLWSRNPLKTAPIFYDIYQKEEHKLDNSSLMSSVQDSNIAENNFLSSFLNDSEVNKISSNFHTIKQICQTERLYSIFSPATAASIHKFLNDIPKFI